MIEEKDLYELGFEKKRDPYKKKEMFMIGEQEIYNDLGETHISPVVHYDLEKRTCQTHQGEFINIGRKCETKDEIRKFVECVNFLYNLSVDIN